MEEADLPAAMALAAMAAVAAEPRKDLANQANNTEDSISTD